METLARSCGEGHWSSAAAGLILGGGVLILMLVLMNWIERR